MVTLLRPLTKPVTHSPLAPLAESAVEHWQRFFAGGVEYKAYRIKQQHGYIYRWDGYHFGVSSSVEASKRMIDILHSDR
jgi:hypothetical protein